MIKITIDGVDKSLNNVEELSRLLNEEHDHPFREIWVEFGEARMSALCVRDQAWLMQLRWPGDVGFSSRNTSFDGDEAEMMEFGLSNGQHDEYPRAWVLPPEIWVRCLVHFARTGQKSPDVEWHYDG